MTTYAKAPINAEGQVVLTPGDYFVEGPLDQFRQAGAQWRTFAFLVEVIDDESRNWVMARMRVPRDALVHRDVSSLMGNWYPIARNVELRQVWRDLYGDLVSEPRGWMEWITTKWPGFTQGTIDVAEGVAHVAEEFTFSIASVGLGIGAAFLGAWLFFTKGGRR